MLPHVCPLWRHLLVFVHNGGSAVGAKGGGGRASPECLKAALTLQAKALEGCVV